MSEKQRNNFGCDAVSRDEACEISEKKKQCALACLFFNIETWIRSYFAGEWFHFSVVQSKMSYRNF